MRVGTRESGPEDQNGNVVYRKMVVCEVLRNRRKSNDKV
jgi:hypothetical protein